VATLGAASKVNSFPVTGQDEVAVSPIIVSPPAITDGQLNIAFGPVTQNPKISAIEVLGGAAAMPSAVATSPYDQWRQLHFTSTDLADPIVSGETCDPDADRINNLMEYALGLDPRVADVQGRPAARLEDGFLVLTYSRNKEATDVVLGVEAATTLEGLWSSAGLTQQVISDDVVIQTMKVIDSVAVGTAESRFLRLTVILR
jgi:hypothetical protein